MASVEWLHINPAGEFVHVKWTPPKRTLEDIKDDFIMDYYDYFRFTGFTSWMWDKLATLDWWLKSFLSHRQLPIWTGSNWNHGWSRDEE